MDVLKAVMKRRSVRDFLDKDIPEDVIEHLTDALLWAPSAGNLQARRFYVVRDPRMKKKLARAALNQSFIEKAPVVIVGCTDSNIFVKYGDRGVFLYSIQDVSLSIMGMMLVATEEGLGTVWVGAFNEADVREALELPDNLRPVAIVPIGYPERVPRAPSRVSKADAIVNV